MATDKRPTMLRLPEDLYEQVRYLAYIERRSINMQIEHALRMYIDNYQKLNGVIPIANPNEDSK